MISTIKSGSFRGGLIASTLLTLPALEQSRATARPRRRNRPPDSSIQRARHGHNTIYAQRHIPSSCNRNYTAFKWKNIVKRPVLLDNYLPGHGFNNLRRVVTHFSSSHLNESNCTEKWVTELRIFTLYAKLIPILPETNVPWPFRRFSVFSLPCRLRCSNG